jgi:hypothetical protein
MFFLCLLGAFEVNSFLDERDMEARNTESNSRVLLALLGDAFRASIDLFKIMIPVIIVVKILQELGLIHYLALPLSPVMKVVGLPGEMGLVWATAMINNPYSAIVVLLSLVKETPISTAQATILCTMMLLAHSLPVELRIAQKSGPRLMFQAFLRLTCAFLLGWFLNLIYSQFGLLQEPATLLLKAESEGIVPTPSLFGWAADQVRNLLSIFLLVLGLFLLMRLLQKLKITDAMNRILRPVLKRMGIGPKASTITVIGLTLGIVYGGGLIIHEARRGGVDKRDVFYSLSLMGLSHGLFEDTLLMMMIGGHLSGILWARLVFSLLAVALLVRLGRLLSEGFCDRFLWGDRR